MKKLMAILLGTLMLFAFCGCNNAGGGKSGQMTVIVDGGEEYTVDLSKVEVTEGVLSVLKYCAEENGFKIKEQSGMLTEFASLKEGGGYYLWIETTCERDFDPSSMATSRDYGGMHFVSSGVGVRQMTVDDGVYIYVSLRKWS